MDELSISEDDEKKIKVGQPSELQELLAWMTANTAMTLAALSSTSTALSSTLSKVSCSACAAGALAAKAASEASSSSMRCSWRENGRCGQELRVPSVHAPSDSDVVVVVRVKDSQDKRVPLARDELYLYLSVDLVQGRPSLFGLGLS